MHIGFEQSDVNVSYVANRYSRFADGKKTDTAAFSSSTATSVRNFHRGFSDYCPTPLVSLDALARSLGIAALWVKDESQRFGLDAFKVLGASHAIGKFMAKELDLQIEDVAFELLRSTKVRKRIGECTFVTATDGNHGRAVAWVAQQLDQKAVIYLPRGSSQARVARIRSLGAEAVVTDGNYDDSVRYAAEAADRNGWVLLQDTAWQGYEQIPLWVMQGYLTMFAEAVEQLSGDKPTHVFIQAGAGSLAGALQGYLRELYHKARPFFAVVEAANAACFYESVKAGDDLPKTVRGDLDTIMAGLAAGRPGSLAWPILRDYSDGFFACSDTVAARGMRTLASPLERDRAVVSGESGAVTTGLVACLCSDAGLRTITDEIRLTQDSNVLLFSTEGATDPDMYRRIVSTQDSK